MLTYRTASGHEFLIDEEDAKTVTPYSWYISKAGYVVSNVYQGTENGRKVRKKLRLQRLIMNAPSGFDVDHINHNKLDNRRVNLEIVTPEENMRRMHQYYKKNPKLGQPGKGGGRKQGMTVAHQGVVYVPPMRKWRVMLLNEIIGWAATKDEGRALRDSMIQEYKKDGRITKVLGKKR